VALIVLDSATFHFRQAFPDAGQRARLMTSMAQQLAALAEQHGVAVVMMNQVSGLLKRFVFVFLAR
jgi:RAD51-like protein 2